MSNSHLVSSLLHNDESLQLYHISHCELHASSFSWQQQIWDSWARVLLLRTELSLSFASQINEIKKMENCAHKHENLHRKENEEECSQRREKKRIHDNLYSYSKLWQWNQKEKMVKLSTCRFLSQTFRCFNELQVFHAPLQVSEGEKS